MYIQIRGRHIHKRDHVSCYNLFGHHIYIFRFDIHKRDDVSCYNWYPQKRWCIRFEATKEIMYHVIICLVTNLIIHIQKRAYSYVYEGLYWRHCCGCIFKIEPNISKKEPWIQPYKCLGIALYFRHFRGCIFKFEADISTQDLKYHVIIWIFTYFLIYIHKFAYSYIYEGLRLRLCCGCIFKSNLSETYSKKSLEYSPTYT